jgi:hypothetical protein
MSHRGRKLLDATKFKFLLVLYSAYSTLNYRHFLRMFFSDSVYIGHGHLPKIKIWLEPPHVTIEELL